MIHIPSSIRQLRAVDILVIVFLHILSLISIIFLFPSSVSILIVIINLIVSYFIIVFARTGRLSSDKAIGKVYDWYPVPMIFFIFKEVHVVIQSLTRNDWDSVLIGIDRAIFGCDPTVWLAKFSSPYITEILQISYASYYFIMLAVGIELYVKKEDKKFSFAIFTIVYGFVLSYFGYLSFPAIGPRFTLHNFYNMNLELPGLWLTNSIRGFINVGESITKDTVNAIAVAQRDVFPSGHTQMTLISIYFAHRYKLKSRLPIYFFGTLLVISTVYLRYHYVIDVVGGTIFTWLTLWSAPKLCQWWKNVKGK